MSSFLNVRSNPNEKFDIVFEMNPAVPAVELPEIDKELYSTVENVTTVIKNLHGTSEKIKKTYFKRLLSTAQIGAVGANPSPELALSSIRLLKEDILTTEGHRIKNNYMTKLGIASLISIGLCWLVYLILDYLAVSPLDTSYFNIWSGSMIGTWVSFGARKFNISFEELSIIEEDKMAIYIRLPYIGVCSLIFLLFLNTNIFSFKIGEFSLDTLNKNHELQLIIGVLAGLLESKLGLKIYNKAETLSTSI
ncbi:hypothetical protein [Bacillus mobilis]|uniref:hypothetical protein n=1 Tax=Bacillus mobilis TaxID=2026190 RepID=UPI003692F30E